VEYKFNSHDDQDNYNNTRCIVMIEVTTVVSKFYQHITIELHRNVGLSGVFMFVGSNYAEKILQDMKHIHQLW